MENNREIENRFFMNKYRVIYIYITSILAYCILKIFIINQNTSIPLMFRIYYIIASIVLFVLLKQVKKFYRKYISTIVFEFFLLMIFISAVGFIININEKSFFSQYALQYISVSKECILLIETFCIYALGEYYCKNKELKKAVYQLGALIIVSVG